NSSARALDRFTEPSPERHRGATHGIPARGHTSHHEPLLSPCPGGDMSRVLIVEDDNVIANAMATHLRRAGLEAEWSDRGDRAIKKIRFERPDVAIVDLMLPGMDGWRMIEALRADGVGIPIIVVSARGSEQDKVHALGIGGDDYLAKPFGMSELVARVKAVLRRARRPPPAAGAAAVTAGRLGSGPDRPAPPVQGEAAEPPPTACLPASA